MKELIENQLKLIDMVSGGKVEVRKMVGETMSSNLRGWALLSALFEIMRKAENAQYADESKKEEGRCQSERIKFRERLIADGEMTREEWEISEKRIEESYQAALMSLESVN